MKRLLCLRLFDADELAEPSALPEHDHAGYAGKQGVVLADADVFAGFEAGAALPDQDGASGYELPPERLYAEPLRIRIAPVFRTAKTFLCAMNLAPTT